MTDTDSQFNRRHVPVLSQDVIRYLAVREGGTYLDCTIGLAGHASQIARLLGPSGHLIGFDRDPKALELAAVACHDTFSVPLGNGFSPPESLVASIVSVR